MNIETVKMTIIEMLTRKTTNTYEVNNRNNDYLQVKPEGDTHYTTYIYVEPYNSTRHNNAFKIRINDIFSLNHKIFLVYAERDADGGERIFFYRDVPTLF